MTCSPTSAKTKSWPTSPPGSTHICLPGDPADQTSASLLPSPRRRADTEGLGEHASEVALVGKAAGHRNLDDRQLRGAQQLLGTLHPLRQQPAVRRQPGDLFERTDEGAAGKPT